MRHTRFSYLFNWSLLAAAALCLGSTPASFGLDRCTLDTIRISEIGSAMSVAACRSSEFLDGVPDLPPGQQISYLDVSFQPTTTTFRGEPRTTVDVRQTAVASAEWARSELAGVIASNIPNDSCDAISAGGVGYSVVGGALAADFDVHYQKRACTDSTCFRGWGRKWGIPYPIFERCLAKTDVPGGSATLGVHVTVTPQLVILPNGDSNIQVQIVPTTAVKEGPSELIKNIVGALTFGIGSKAIQDQFEHQVGEFRSSLTPELRTVAQLKLPQARKQPAEITFVPEQPQFLQAGSQIAMSISRVAHVQPSVACEIRKQAIQAQKFFQSCVNPQRQYVVQTNDSLWRIAENLYGEGQFYHVLRQHNNMSERIDFLKPGQTLAVPAYFEIQGSNEVVVSSGDTLWKIAGRKLGNPALYRELIQHNRSEVTNPKKLTTLMALKVK
jgi:LysM repeat protein